MANILEHVQGDINVTKLKFHTQFDPPTHEGLHCCEESLTKQSFKEECDINVILRRFEQTGQAPELRQQGHYGDFSDVPTYQESLNIVIQAHEMFDAQPSKIRDRFANDPIKFLEFVNDPQNKDEMYTLGLAVKPTTSHQSPTPSSESSPDAV